MFIRLTIPRPVAHKLFSALIARGCGNKKEEATLRQPQEILAEMRELDEESAEILKSIEEWL